MPRVTPPIVRSGGFSVGPPPSFPPSFGLIGSHADWRNTWTHIVAGKFSNSSYSGILFYEQSSGYAEFYNTDGQGGISFLQSQPDWRNSWTHIVSGAFFGPKPTGLLFYDQQAGFAAIYNTDTGNLITAREYRVGARLGLTLLPLLSPEANTLAWSYTIKPLATSRFIAAMVRESCSS